MRGGYPLCLAVMRMHNAAGMQFELNRLLQATGRAIVLGDDATRKQRLR